MLVKELLVEGDLERHMLARQVARMMKVEYDATFYDSEYLTAAKWLLFQPTKTPDPTTQRVMDMFKKLHTTEISDEAARNLMYQEFVTKPGFGKMAYKLSMTDKDRK